MGKPILAWGQPCAVMQGGSRPVLSDAGISVAGFSSLKGAMGLDSDDDEQGSVQKQIGAGVGPVRRRDRTARTVKLVGSTVPT